MEPTPTPDRANEGATVQAIENCFDVISAMVELGGQGGVTEIANEVHMSKGNVHKHLATLVEQGYVVKEGGKYRLSLKFLDVGSFMRVRYGGTRFIKQKMWEVAHETNEIAFFTIEEGGRPVILYREVGSEGVSTRSRVGMRLYLHQLAAGKAILSQYSESRVDEIIDQHGLPSATENTITEYDELQEELQQAARQGYAESTGEATKGLHAVAVPVMLPDGEVFGACAVAGPVHRIGDRAHDELPKLLQSVANELELNIVYTDG